MSSKRNFKISVSGVRGVVGDTLTPSLIAGFAASFGEYVGGGKVAIGRDTRPTGPMVEQAVIAGLLSVGCQPLILGCVPTPTIQIIVDEYRANGGIAITASHNPEEWNALKFIGSSGIFLNYQEAEELLNVYNQPERNFVSESEFRSIRTLSAPFSIHKKRIFNIIHPELIQKSKFKVAMDCGNGVGSFFSESFLHELGCETVMLFDETDGIFRRKPEPTPANLSKLCQLVKQEHCDIGFAQDPDADRLVVVDNHGNPVGEQSTLALAVKHILSQTPGPVAVNIQTSMAIADLAKQFNCPLHYTKVGEINVTSEMLNCNAIIGGEGGSGGIIYPSVHPCRDSFTGIAIILQMMSMLKQPISKIVQDLPQYKMANDRLDCTASKAFEVINILRHKHSSLKQNVMDGLRIDFPDAWIIIRPSNTEPIIRLSAEAKNINRAQDLVKQFKEEIIQLINQL